MQTKAYIWHCYWPIQWTPKKANDSQGVKNSKFKIAILG